MNSPTTHRTSPVSRSLQVWTSVRDGFRENRRARSADRALARELAAYNTLAEVHDLLAVISEQEGPEVERVRRILTRNLQGQQHTNSLAS